MTKDEKKKARERMHLDAFLQSKGWDSQVASIEAGEGPDFLVTRVDDTTFGVELRDLCGGPVNDHGAVERRTEALGNAFLHWVQHHYYFTWYGPPAHVLLQTFPEQRHGLEMDEAFAVHVAGWLSAEARALAPLCPSDEPALLIEDQRRLASAHVDRLPDDYERYTRGWRLLNHAVGWVRALTTELLQPAIDEKRALLDQYRLRVPTTLLLLVADGTYASGMFGRESPKVERGDFSAVHLLYAPGTESLQLA